MSTSLPTPSTHEVNDMPRIHPLILSLWLVVPCSSPITHSAEHRTVLSAVDALKGRSVDAKLDQPAVAALAHAAQARWPREFHGFPYQRFEHFIEGGFGGDASVARSAKRLTCGSGITPGGGGNNGFGVRPTLDLPQHPATASTQRAVDIDPRIWCIHQDRSGNYWFGSNGNGVYRYKDQTITQYTQADGLIGGQVRDIEEDSNGAVLVSTNGGVSKFDGKKFNALKMVEAPSSEVGWVLDPKDVWIVCDPGKHGICRYDGETLHRLRLPTSPAEDAHRAKYPGSSFSPSGVYSIYKDRRGHLWFGTASVGLCRYDGQSWSWLYEESLTTTPSGGAFGIRSVYEDRSGDLWVCNTRQRFKVSLKSKVEGKYRLLDYAKSPGLPEAQADKADNFSYYSSMTEDTAGSLWMACGSDGVWKYNGKVVKHYSLADGAYAISIYHDQGGKLWVGTLQHGVYTFGGERFEPFAYAK